LYINCEISPRVEANISINFDTPQPQFGRCSTESLFIGVDGEPNRRLTQARKDVSRREGFHNDSEEGEEGGETSEDIDIS
jgi:hypothetical protein